MRMIHPQNINDLNLYPKKIVFDFQKGYTQRKVLIWVMYDQ